jgi:hypothetical protein
VANSAATEAKMAGFKYPWTRVPQDDDSKFTSWGTKAASDRDWDEEPEYDVDLEASQTVPAERTGQLLGKLFRRLPSEFFTTVLIICGIALIHYWDKDNTSSTLYGKILHENGEWTYHVDTYTVNSSNKTIARNAEMIETIPLDSRWTVIRDHDLYSNCEIVDVNNWHCTTLNGYDGYNIEPGNGLEINMLQYYLTKLYYIGFNRKG